MRTVIINKKSSKNIGKFPQKIRESFFTFVLDMREGGSLAERMPNYGKLKSKENIYHCHLNKGKPRFVAVWKVTEDENGEIVEVLYAGSHEGADYKRFK